MSDNEKVVRLPDALERRALRIEAAIKRRINGDSEWVEGTIDLAVELREARSEFTENKQFGFWFDRCYGSAAITPHDRSILIRWGAAPDDLRAILTKEDSRSIRMIDRNHPDVGDAPRAKAPSPPSPTTTAVREEAKEVIRAYKAQYGAYPNVREAERTSGRSRIVVEPALAAVIAEDKIAPTQFVYTKAQDQQVEARVKAHVKVRLAELERDFAARLQKETKANIDRSFPKLEQMREEAKRTEKFYREQIEKRAILSVPEYLDILKACHPDNSASKEVRERAFVAISTKRLQLTGTN
jgi:hypothetical protein